jgi:transmembrane sensor
MNTSESIRSPCSPEELDEAAVWIARLRAPDRTLNVERGFERWLSEKPSHEAAFEVISNAWEFTGALQRRPLPRLTRWQRTAFRSGFLRSTAGLAAAAAIAATGVFFYLQFQGVATDIGEQRVLTLEDGSRISLNTASRVVVKYDEDERRVELKAGEALFEVARQADRPFVVAVGNRRIKALGTSFVVREQVGRLSVTLIEGSVAVTGGKASAGSSASNQNSGESRQPSPGAPPDVYTLMPGERLTLASGNAADIDRPQIDEVTAWRRGQVELEDAALADAVAEMNRYSQLRLVIETPEAAALRINGVFRAGDTAGFAAAVSRSYGLGVKREARAIVLTGAPIPETLSPAPLRR